MSAVWVMCMTSTQSEQLRYCEAEGSITKREEDKRGSLWLFDFPCGRYRKKWADFPSTDYQTSIFGMENNRKSSWNIGEYDLVATQELLHD